MLTKCTIQSDTAPPEVPCHSLQILLPHRTPVCHVLALTSPTNCPAHRKLRRTHRRPHLQPAQPERPSQSRPRLGAGQQTLSFFETKGTGKDASHALWVVDAATGQRSVLLSAEKLEAALPTHRRKNSQATGLGRHAPPQYQWAPSGRRASIRKPESLVWFDLKSQAGRVLVYGNAESCRSKNLSRRKIRQLRARPQSLAGRHRGWKRTRYHHGRHGRNPQRRTRLGLSRRTRHSPLRTGGRRIPPPSPIWRWTSARSRNFSLWISNSYTGEAEPQRYPVAGGKNPVVHVFVASAAGGEAALDGHRRRNQHVHSPRQLAARFEPSGHPAPESRADRARSPACRRYHAAEQQRCLPKKISTGSMSATTFIFSRTPIAFSGRVNAPATAISISMT